MGQIVRWVGLVLFSLAALYNGLLVIAAGLNLSRVGGNDSYGVGRVMGTLLVTLVCVAIAQRFWRGIRRRG